MTIKHSKVALVTGATRGIGLATAHHLASEGVLVLLGGRDTKNVECAVAKLRASRLPVEGCVVDITSSNSISLLVDFIDSKYGVLDILVNNAGIRIEEYDKNPSEQPIDQWKETFETNLFGTISVTNALLPLLKRSSFGRIVNLSSLLGSIETHSDKSSYAYSPKFKSLPAYSASKSALNSWTVHLAYELRDTQIKVNAAHPGYTRTDLNDGEGELDVEDGAKTSVALALLPDGGPTGEYYHMDTKIPW